jgi:cell division protein FtsB
MLRINSKALSTVFAILLLFLQYELWFASGGISEVWHLKHDIVAINEQNLELRDRNAILTADVENLKEGNEAIEERARMDLGMIKKNETFYQVVRVQK